MAEFKVGDTIYFWVNSSRFGSNIEHRKVVKVNKKTYTVACYAYGNEIKYSVMHEDAYTLNEMIERLCNRYRSLLFDLIPQLPEAERANKVNYIVDEIVGSYHLMNDKNFLLNQIPFARK